MANVRSTYFATGLIFLLLCYPKLILSLEVHDGEQGAEGGGDGLVHVKVTERYFLLWDRMSVKPRRCWSNFTLNVESVECTNNATCANALCDLNIALSYPSNLPSAPYCILPAAQGNESTTKLGHCTCGPSRCLSYSLDSSHNGNPFYYCGPCGWVGSECVNTSCTHYMAECRSGFCECISDGSFYDMTYCYIPFYGKEMALGMFIATSIIIIFCAALAYGCQRLTRRRERGYPESWFRGSITRESPPDDTPPTYDDVVEKLPSYQDALDMFNKDDSDGGLSNPAFKSYSSPPSYHESENFDSASTPSLKHSAPTCTSELQQNDDRQGAQILGVSGPLISQTPTTTTVKMETEVPPSQQVGQSASTGSEFQPIDLPIQEALLDLQTTEVSK
ncbi:uncharacterized protein [Panulirus ornatus]|uniref:uncharacterized protein n=1 Tax=Panulirus ornatus TaxID=150431 RepID=UPI003A880281